jgi:hypothetical protein
LEEFPPSGFGIIVTMGSNVSWFGGNGIKCKLVWWGDCGAAAVYRRVGLAANESGNGSRGSVFSWWKRGSFGQSGS